MYSEAILQEIEVCFYLACINTFVLTFYFVVNIAPLVFLINTFFIKGNNWQEQYYVSYYLGDNYHTV